jgi:transcriptional regulator with XRE-family HTH domain
MARQPKNHEQAISVVDDPDDIVKQVAQRLQEARKRAGLSTSLLAERAGVKQTYIYELEYGTTNLSIKTLDKIAKALNCDIRDLFPGPPLAVPTGGDLKHLHDVLDCLVTTVKDHVSDEKRRTADEKRRVDAETERRRKSENALLAEVKPFVELRDAIARIIDHARTGTEQQPPTSAGIA